MDNMKQHLFENSLKMKISYYRGKDFDKADDYYQINKEGCKSFEDYLKKEYNFVIGKKDRIAYQKISLFLNSYPIFCFISYEISSFATHIKFLADNLKKEKNKVHSQFWGSQLVNWRDFSKTDFSNIQKKIFDYKKVMDLVNNNIIEEIE